MPVRLRLWARVLRGVGQFFLWTIVGGVGLWLGGLLSLHLLLSSEKGQALARRWIVALLSEVLETDVELRSLRLSGIAHISLEGFRMYDKACQPFIQVKEVTLVWYPSAFWRGIWLGRWRLPLSSIKLNTPEVYIYTDRSGIVNVDRLFPSTDTTPPKPSRWEVSLSSLELHNGRFHWIDSTAKKEEIEPRPGYLQYANLLIDSLELRGQVEWKGQGYLFAQAEHLSFYEAHSQLKLAQLQLTLQAYPDSTVIPYLHLQVGQSTLTGQGRFPLEGLDKLFRNTETKLFFAHLKGRLAWEDLSVFAGENLPLRGSFEADLHIQGDLYHLRAEPLLLRLSPESYLYGSGKIIHYARPKKLQWNFTLHEASFTLHDVQKTLSDLGELPPLLNTSYRWRLRGTHAGRIGFYATDLQAEGIYLSLTLNQDTSWHYTFFAQCFDWSLTQLLTKPFVQDLSGTVKVKGKGFALERIEAEVDLNLSGKDKDTRLWHIQTLSTLQNGTARGFFAAQTPYLAFQYEGSLPLGLNGEYQGEGTFTDLAASLWGSMGTLRGDFAVQGKGIPWAEGHATLSIQKLRWQHPETTYTLGALFISAEEGKKYSLRGRAVELSLYAEGSWQRHLPLWIERWLRGDTTVPDTLLASWKIETQIHIGSPVWEALLGVPQSLSISRVRAHLFMQADSSVPSGVLHVVIDTLKWKDLQLSAPYLTLYLRQDSLEAEIGSVKGQAYLAYEALSAHMKGTWTEGVSLVEAFLSERKDTIDLKLRWEYKAQLLRLQILSEASMLAIGGERWRFEEAAPILINWEKGDWSLSALALRSSEAQLHLSHTEGRLEVSLYRFPLEIGAKLVGQDIPIQGRASLLWQEQERGPRFALEIDSLRYKGQAYPYIQVAGEPSADSITFQVSVRQGNTPYLHAKGSYALNSSTDPLYLELRSVRLPVEWFIPFLGEYIQNPKGTLLAQRLIVRGKLESPLLFGEIFCDNLSFYMPLTRVVYVVEGVMRLRGDTLYFPGLELREVQGKRSYITGYVALRQWSSPYLNLKAQVRDRSFLLAASSAASDAYLYGRAEIEQGNITITGPWNQPAIRGEVLFSGNTDLTLPLRTYERSSGAEHVRFVKVLEEKDTIPTIVAPTGVDVRIGIRSVPEARFHLLFDERTGDEIFAQGTANLLFSIDRTGQTTLSGSYEVQSGEYRVNLQGIASKKLSLEPGSRITWDGNLYQGRMDITATYRTFTSLRMIDTSFSYTVPVELRVYLQGLLLSPLMKFQIEVPSLSGTPTPLVNLFLQRLATDEQERNRQVFALLVLGTFVPLEQGFGTQQVSSGVSSTLAEFLSAQLASWVGHALGNQVGVAFSLGEWNELSARLRLNLGQRFTLERDGVLVGPGQNTAALGNLSARYRIYPKRVTQPTQWQLEVEGFSRQTFMWGSAGATSQGAGLRLRKSFYPTDRRRRNLKKIEASDTETRSHR
ncbi:MAG: translocation/assembly module TamB domain-containing protein [Bacteroidia bacterium]|nr:translocation/assembly module TamB domain-containing protein [Bacteroidia bacterium]MDW8057234.1 translocation/assembly module TamB domain-containing protein [Bacteroidia bacterium]